MSAEAKRKSDADPLVGVTLSGRFEVVAPIARGGMGRVYQAIQHPLGRTVALKVLDVRGVTEPHSDFHRRFFLEAATAARLTHPNTVVIYDYGMTEDQVYFIAMEYIVGQTLSQLLKAAGPVDPARSVHVAMQIAGSLGEAHAQGIVHRDLKPSNVLLTTRGSDPDFVKVLDFGLVKVLSDDTADDFTQSGVMMGTPKYMSPEQINARDVTKESDIYSLGALLYHALVGRPPFEGETKFDILEQHVRAIPTPFREIEPSCTASTALEAIVMQCLAKAPSARFASMEDLAIALRNVDPVQRGSTESERLLNSAEELEAAVAAAPATVVTATPFMENAYPLGPASDPRGSLAPVTEESAFDHSVAPSARVSSKEREAPSSPPERMRSSRPPPVTDSMLVELNDSASGAHRDSPQSPYLGSGGLALPDDSYARGPAGRPSSDSFRTSTPPPRATPISRDSDVRAARGLDDLAPAPYVSPAPVFTRGFGIALIVVGLVPAAVGAWFAFKPQSGRGTGSEIIGSSRPPRPVIQQPLEVQHTAPENVPSENTGIRVVQVGGEQPAARDSATPLVAANGTLVPVRLESEPRGARVRHDGRDLGDAPLVLPVPVGESWTVEVSMRGYATRTIHLTAGQDIVRVRLPRSSGGHTRPRGGGTRTDNRDPWGGGP